MPDIFHEWGKDVQWSPTGGMRTVDGTVLGQQRIERRLLTNKGDYYYDLNYGGSLGQFIGQTNTAGRLHARIVEQMGFEAVVDQTVPALIDQIDNPDGTTIVTVQYTDATTGDSSILSAPLKSG